MAVPVLLIAGFLGAGKTTLLTRMLSDPGGKRIAAVVNDFGAIDIDASLLGAVSEDVVSLKNGCICCTLQGDLLRTLATVMRRSDPPELIVIETSGISDPAEIVRSLLDPVIFKAAALDTVITIVDAALAAERRELLDDPLWQSQVKAADFVILNKVDLIDAEMRALVRSQVARWKPSRSIFDTVNSVVPGELLVSGGEYAPVHPAILPATISSPRFETRSWTSAKPLSLEAFQSVVTQMAKTLVRAKGILTFVEKPGQPMQFQLVGTRATVSPTDARLDDGIAVKLVLISDAMDADPQNIVRLLERAYAEI